MVSGMKKRVSVRIHPAGAAMLAALLIFAPSAEVLAGVAALLWHETAHIVVMLLCGVKRCHVELTPFGGMADAEGFASLSYGKQAICAASGVLASALGTWMVARWSSTGPFWNVLYRMNLSLAMINCLPVWPLDGARVCLALAGRLGWEIGARRLMQWLAWLVAVLLVALGLYGAWYGSINLSLFLVGPYLCYAAQQGNISETVRRLRRSGRQLSESSAVPVFLAACRSDAMASARRMLVPRFGAGQYCMLAQIDPETCRVERFWTEQEMLHSFLKSSLEETDTETAIDKDRCL